MSDPTLVEFLRARLDEDEAAARAATPGPWVWEPPSGGDFPMCDQSLIALRDAWVPCPHNCRVSRSDLCTRQRPGGGHEHRTTETVVSGWGYDACGTEASDADRAHIARYDPSHVLADIAAKRRMLVAHPAEQRWIDERQLCDDEPRVVEAGWDYPLVLRLLAEPYADHPDYCEEWRA